MYRTRVGLNFIEKFSKRFKKSLKYIGYASIIICFLGMALISFALIQNIYVLLTKPAAAPGVGLVLPFKVKGVFFVPFFYWIIAIFIIAVVHEFSHGIIAKTHNLKIKSSGFAFLGVLLPVIPAAFVEPDEKQLKKRPPKQQLSVFAAGPFSNILLAFIIILLSSFIIAPIVNAMIELDGIKVRGLIKEEDKKLPAELAGIKEGEVIKSVDNITVNELGNFSKILRNKKPGQIVKITTNRTTYNVTLTKNPENESISYLGVYVEQSAKIKDSVKENLGNALPGFFLWFVGLIRILIILNLGIGLFNLVPIGPLDGGRMLHLALQRLFKEEKGQKIAYYIGMFFLTLVFMNIAFAFIR